jgi:hypothetical protein
MGMFKFIPVNTGLSQLHTLLLEVSFQTIFVNSLSNN